MNFEKKIIFSYLVVTEFQISISVPNLIKFGRFFSVRYDVVEQMTQHLDENNLMQQCQSAYRKHHSTESALMKVLSDILDVADCRL